MHLTTENIIETYIHVDYILSMEKIQSTDMFYDIHFFNIPNTPNKETKLQI